MSMYPVLNDQPIDQWKVTELKDELCRRNLPIKGLKDDLVKRLFEDLQGGILGGEGTVGTPPDDDVKVDKSSGSADASIYQAPLMELNVDEGSFEVGTREGYLCVSVTEGCKGSAVATTDVISQEAFLAAAEVSDALLAAVATNDEISLTDAVAVKGEDLESVASDGTMVGEVSPQAEGHSEIVVKKSPEEGTSKKMIVDELQSDVISSNLKLSAISGKIELGAEIPEQEAVLSPPNAITSYADAVATAPVQNSDTLIPEINSGGNASINVMGATSAEGELGAKIPEQEAVSSPPDALTSHADPCDVDAIATAPEQTTEILIPEINSGADALINVKDHEDSKHTNGDCKSILSGPKDQVHEASPDLGSQMKCVSISHDNVSTDVKGNLNTDNSDLELEATRDMVKPSSSIPSVGDDLPALGDDKFSKSEISLQEIDSTTNMNLGEKEGSLDGGSPEKLNLGRSSGDETMEDVMESRHVDSNIKSDDLGGKIEFTSEHETMEDVMESRHVDSNIKSDDLGGKIEFTSEHEVKGVTLPDTVSKDASVHAKEIVAEGKSAALTEKRKPEAQDVLANEPIKHPRRWDAVSVKSPEQQASKLSGSDAHKDVFRPALKRYFGRSDSTASGNPPKERIVPPSQKPTTTSLRVDRFVRPFTLKAVQQLLGETGSVCYFWMDHIKTHCYVTYSSVEEAVATRNAVYNLQWPPNYGNYLVAEFVDPHEVKLKLEAPAPSPVLISLSTATTPNAVPFQQSKANQTIPRLGPGTLMGLLPTPQTLTKPSPTSNSGPGREMLPPPPRNPKTSPMSLDDLFKRTQTSPRIYYMPLSEEEVSARLAARNKRKFGRHNRHDQQFLF